jgi:hypothetical protein
MPQCLQCNAGLPAGAKFCGRCGTAVQPSQPGSPSTGAATVTPPPTAAPPATAQGWASGPSQQWVTGAAAPEASQQWDAGAAPPGASQQWGSGPAQPWQAGAGQQWGTGGAAAAPPYPVAAPAGGAPGQAVAGGILAIVGALGIIAGCALPVTTSTGFGAAGSSISLFKEYSNGAAWWFLIEPVGVAILALVAGLIIMASHSRVAPIVAAGILVGFGIQTVFLFLGYWRGFSGGQQAGPAGIVGILAGVLLAVAGLVAGAAAPRT